VSPRKKPVVLWLLWREGESCAWAMCPTQKKARLYKQADDAIVRIEVPAELVPGKRKST